MEWRFNEKSKMVIIKQLLMLLSLQDFCTVSDSTDFNGNEMCGWLESMALWIQGVG